ncbi:adenylate/guanylate cyclase domain-containing protein [Aestuariirhabdus sp. Z084]|uniref:adenylate/guanylate cyclase domain-containing protein n=1 Tax=Aestuariirhabdus haliotis TaxID=2918751 RepID=UPI00201B43B3|nr:adenylate/guanylate cyclase domain-containing protein [Aestuariirhabdus haliotis]MCL6416434.1 adenylate/guanylate cyclase domain-containing protein [Aestuariirhabdus haliotis]MCL6420400.1 adenylate/guanylate cyclase domain-containing protein [Aestuariirhabdus haliotis]
MPRQISITTLLSVGFGFLMIVAVITVSVIGVNTTRSNTFNLVSQLANSALGNLQSEIKNYLQPINAQLDYIAQLMQEGHISPDEPIKMEASLSGSLSALPQVYGMAYINDQYEMQIYERENALFFTHNWQQTTSLEPFFSTPSKIETVLWGDAEFTSDGIRIIPVTRMVYLPDGRKGMLLTAIDVQQLNEHLSQYAGEHTEYFMLLGKQKLLASSFSVPHVTPSEKNPLLDIASLDEHPISKIWSSERYATDLQLPAGMNSHLVYINDQPWIYIYSEVRTYSEVPITLGMMVSNQALSSEFRALILQVVFSALMLLLFVFLCWSFSRRLGQRFTRIAEGFEAIEESQLDDIETIQGSSIKEFDQVATAYNRMTDSLRQNEKMRNLFGQYVPADIARRLVKQEGELAPQEELATIFFVDLEGFTSLSERLSPEQLITTLNAFFSMVAEELEREGGIITQFQGDAVLAIFNIPNPQPDHALRALNAARRVLMRTEQERFNEQSLHCRIGINSGEVIAGNVGAPKRQNYTVHGDAVNLASRLEALNKEYGTRLMLSESSVQQIPDQRFRELGKISIRGKSQAVRVYTLPGA